MNPPPSFQDRIAGLLLGTAVGDALGLPREGLSKQRAARIFGKKPLTHRLIFGRGLLSDDTEHTCMVAQAWLACDRQPERFARSLAWRLRFWLLGLPAGVGLGTAKGIIRLWLGFPVSKSGVRSAGNGPAMRSGLLGPLAGDSTAQLREFVEASTHLTHRDDRATEGALAVALACRYAAASHPEDICIRTVFSILRRELTNRELLDVLAKVEQGLADGLSTEAMAEALGLERGVSGYVVHTVPVAIFSWLRHPMDFEAAVTKTI
jgi:ADP-ribosyl-[dinitrogen reductase] hydrolase